MHLLCHIWYLSIFQPSKKNVRFADLCYEEQDNQGEEETEDDKLFVRRNKGTSTGQFRSKMSLIITLTSIKFSQKSLVYNA